MNIGQFREALQLMRLDAARWIRPEQVADPAEVTVITAVRLLWRHLPLRAMFWLRLAAAARYSGIPGVSGWVQRRLLVKYGLEIRPSRRIGGGLYIAHPVGCVLHAESIGTNVTIVSNVTFGAREGRWPAIGDRAFLGAGARVIGGVTVGADARIGANAVVLSDVPPDVAAVGVPARVLSPPSHTDRAVR